MAQDLEQLISSKTILDQLTDGVYFTDPQRQILYWNPGAERISGYSASEVVGTHCWDNILMHVDEDGRSLCHGACPLAKAMQHETPLETEAFLRHKAGHRVPVLIRTIPVRDAAGRVAGAVEIFSDRSAALAREERIRQLETLALIDGLTGLPNRRYLEMMIQARLEARERYGWPVGLCFLDMDDFKRINDERGHDAGDDVLRMVGQTLAGIARATDTAGRWGGEELLVICENVDGPGLDAAAERIRRLVAASEIPAEAGALRVTVSIGATLARDGDTVETLTDRADTLMYRSKQRGKNCVTLG